ncbi:uncharacterized protein [Dysidea avara]|uniref:uncharacterized protein n=1 Tax=Dysidea avara TaxID=196820 RepID=UPI0033281003
MSSWTIEKSGLNRDHRFKGFHKSNFSEPTRVKPDANRHNYRHGLVQHFVEPGIEAKGEGNQLAYGSDTKYSYEIQKRASFSEELEKKKKQQREFEDFIETHKRQKASREATIAEQKRKDLEMLQKYQPWGQPSGGAPRVDNDGERHTRRHRIEWESTSQTEKNFDEDYNQTLPLGKPGGGAPRRTNSGKLQTSIASDPTIRFQRNFKKDVDHVLRYKSPEKAQEYAQSLEQQVLEQYPKERHPFPYQDNDYHPYGKPGGGAPLRGHNGGNGFVAATKNQFEGSDEDTDEKRQKALRYARRLEQQRIEAMTRKTKEADELKQPTSYYPWERSHPRRDSSGNVARHRQTLRSKMAVEFDDESTKTTPKARLPRTFGIHGDGTVLDSSTVTHAEEEMFDPWGRPGGGAPITNENGKVVTASQQHFNGKKEQQTGK